MDPLADGVHPADRTVASVRSVDCLVDSTIEFILVIRLGMARRADRRLLRRQQRWLRQQRWVRQQRRLRQQWRRVRRLAMDRAVDMEVRVVHPAAMEAQAHLRERRNLVWQQRLRLR